jgi:NADH:ubiquinone oxidoreductase subunit C
LLYISFLKQIFPFTKIYVFNDEIILRVNPQTNYKIIKFLSKHQLLSFKVLADICGIDYPEKKNRFEVVYNLLSLNTNFRLTVTTSLREGISLLSITSIYKGAN